jgi:hypothetical protein
LKNPIWLDVLPNLKDLENAQSTMQNLSKGWQYMKGCQSKDDQHGRNVIILVVASNFMFNICQTNLLTKIHRRNFKQEMERKLGLESCMDVTF